MVASGQVDVKPLITHNYQLEETLQAFQRAKTGEGGAIKVTKLLPVIMHYSVLSFSSEHLCTFLSRIRSH